MHELHEKQMKNDALRTAVGTKCKNIPRAADQHAAVHRQCQPVLRTG